MNDAYLRVTYRGGKPLAAYYSLPRDRGEKCAQVRKYPNGLVVDLAEDGRLIGVEIAIPSLVTVEGMNEILTSYGLEPIDAAELEPLKHAA